MATAYGVIGGILLFGALGGVIDERFRTKPWATLIGFLAGVTIVLYGLGLSMRERLADRHGRITRSVKR